MEQTDYILTAPLQVFSSASQMSKAKVQKPNAEEVAAKKRNIKPWLSGSCPKILSLFPLTIPPHGTF